MKSLSLKLNDDIFAETEQILSSLKENRNKYINNAVDYFNQVQKKRILATRLAEESRLVRKDSMKVLGEFEKLDDDGTAI
jgi:hypothetical protein